MTEEVINYLTGNKTAHLKLAILQKKVNNLPFNEEEWAKSMEKLMGIKFDEIKTIISYKKEEDLIQEELEKKIPEAIKTYSSLFEKLMEKNKDVEKDLKEYYKKYPSLIVESLLRREEIKKVQDIRIRGKNILEVFIRPRCEDAQPDLAIQRNEIIMRADEAMELAEKFNFKAVTIRINGRIEYAHFENITLVNQVTLDDLIEKMKKTLENSRSRTY